MERFLAYTNEFPWTWTPVMAEEFFSDLRSISRRKQSTIRGYQNALRLFCSYVSHPDYGWDRVCEQRFGAHPAQVFFEWNTAAHVQDNEQSPAKRAFTKRELQEFFDHADDQVALIAASGRKGWLPAYRDAVMFKLAYSYGLRFNEVRHLQTVDFSRNPHAREFGRYGVVHVRYGKAKKGSATQTPQRVDRVRLDAGSDRRLAGPRTAIHGRRHRPVPQRDAERWWPKTPCCADSAATATISALSAGLDLHSLRRSYATHLIEDGWDAKFVQDQLGHEHASTTSLYTCVSSDYRCARCAVSWTPPSRTHSAFGERGDAHEAKVDYAWRLAEIMAAHGMHNSTDLIPRLAERGIQLSRPQVYRMVHQRPERMSLQLLAALCDIFGCGVEDLLTVTATDVRRKKAAAPRRSLRARTSSNQQIRAAAPGASAP